jgi:Tat protein secretion system quality control protein TatD with DNase activity
MNKFNQFDIKVKTKGFEGDKIKMSKILNREIVVHAFKIEDSKVKAFQEKGSGKCLHMQISINDEMHIVFTSSHGLMEAIQQIPDEGFPFTTTIIQENERFRFT